MEVLLPGRGSLLPGGPAAVFGAVSCYCKPGGNFFKGLFEKNSGFFQLFLQKTQGFLPQRGAPGAQGGQFVQQEADAPAGEQKIHSGAGQSEKQQIQPGGALEGAHAQGEQAQQRPQGKQKIRQEGQRPARPPQRAEQVVNQAQEGAGEQCGGPLGQLEGDRQRHQRNSRDQRLPLWAVSS